MQQVFTNQNIALVGSMRSYLEEHGIPSQLRNEYSSSIMGEVSFFLVWPELWVADHNVARAKQLLDQLDNSQPAGPDWLCRHCNEENPGSFDVCWQCAKPLDGSKA